MRPRSSATPVASEVTLLLTEWTFLSVVFVKPPKYLSATSVPWRTMTTPRTVLKSSCVRTRSKISWTASSSRPW